MYPWYADGNSYKRSEENQQKYVKEKNTADFQRFHTRISLSAKNKKVGKQRKFSQDRNK